MLTVNAFCKDRFTKCFMLFHLIFGLPQMIKTVISCLNFSLSRYRVEPACL